MTNAEAIAKLKSIPLGFNTEEEEAKVIQVIDYLTEKPSREEIYDKIERISELDDILQRMSEYPDYYEDMNENELGTERSVLIKEIIIHFN